MFLPGPKPFLTRISKKKKSYINNNVKLFLVPAYILAYIPVDEIVREKK